jgi:hypothetical protein
MRICDRLQIGFDTNSSRNLRYGRSALPARTALQWRWTPVNLVRFPRLRLPPILELKLFLM